MNRLKHCFCYIIALTLILPTLSSCNNEDDVIDIFTGRTWKLSRFTIAGSTAPFPPDFWQNEASYNTSMTAFREPNNFIITFSSKEENGYNQKEISAQGIKATLNGSWNADGKTNTFSIKVKQTSTESDPLAKAFIAGLQTTYKYEGDSQSLILYFKYNNKDMIMGLIPQNKD